MKLTRLTPILFALFLNIFAFADAQLAGLLPGEYRGYILMRSGQPNQAENVIPTELQIVRQSGGDLGDLNAFLTTYLGGWQSHEYVTHSFSIPDYIWPIGRISLVVNHPLAEAALSIDKGFVIHGGKMLIGTVSATVAFDPGILVLVHESASGDSDFQEHDHTIEGLHFPSFSDLKKKPLVPGITGHYQTTPDCHDDVALQLEAIKVSTDVKGCLNALAGYRIQGRHGKRNTTRRFHIEPFTLSGHLPPGLNYDFYYERIYIPDFGMCAVTQAGLHCTDSAPTCLLKRRNDSLAKHFIQPTYTRPNRNVPVPAVSAEEELKTPLLDGDVTGHFRGQLHFERRDGYAQVELNVSLAGSPQAGESLLSQKDVAMKGHLIVSSGPLDSATKIPLIFEAKEFPRALPFKNLVIKGKKEEGKEDPLLDIQIWTKHRIGGVAYSKTYGRIGTFELERVELGAKTESLPCTLPRIETRFSLRAQNWSRSFNFVLVPDHFHVGMGGFPYLLAGQYRERPLKAVMRENIYQLKPGWLDPTTGSFQVESVAGHLFTGKLTPAGIEVYQVRPGNYPLAGFGYQTTELFLKQKEK